MLSRDNCHWFDAREFDRRRDDRANTLTLLSDSKGHVFSGFTPVKLESGKWNMKAGEEINSLTSGSSLSSFLFSLTNSYEAKNRSAQKGRSTQSGAIRQTVRGFKSVILSFPINVVQREIVSHALALAGVIACLRTRFASSTSSRAQRASD
jgi:hypothetical protein